MASWQESWSDCHLSSRLVKSTVLPGYWQKVKIMVVCLSIWGNKLNVRVKEWHESCFEGENLGQSPSSTSPQVFSASIFYKIPASGGEEEQQGCIAKVSTRNLYFTILIFPLQLMCWSVCVSVWRKQSQMSGQDEVSSEAGSSSAKGRQKEVEDILLKVVWY